MEDLAQEAAPLWDPIPQTGSIAILPIVHHGKTRWSGKKEGRQNGHRRNDLAGDWFHYPGRKSGLALAFGDLANQLLTDLVYLFDHQR